MTPLWFSATPAPSDCAISGVWEGRCGVGGPTLPLLSPARPSAARRGRGCGGWGGWSCCVSGGHSSRSRSTPRLAREASSRHTLGGQREAGRAGPHSPVAPDLGRGRRPVFESRRDTPEPIPPARAIVCFFHRRTAHSTQSPPFPCCPLFPRSPTLIPPFFPYRPNSTERGSVCPAPPLFFFLLAVPLPFL